MLLLWLKLVAFCFNFKALSDNSSGKKKKIIIIKKYIKDHNSIIQYLKLKICSLSKYCLSISTNVQVFRWQKKDALPFYTRVQQSTFGMKTILKLHSIL